MITLTPCLEIMETVLNLTLFSQQKNDIWLLISSQWFSPLQSDPWHTELKIKTKTKTKSLKSNTGWQTYAINGAFWDTLVEDRKHLLIRMLKLMTWKTDFSVNTCNILKRIQTPGIHGSHFLGGARICLHFIHHWKGCKWTHPEEFLSALGSTAECCCYWHFFWRIFDV